MNENSKKIWITGASSGIGKELAIKFANSGWIVAASARRKNLLEKLSEINKNIKPFPLDITEKGNVEQTFKKIISEFVDLDVCIFNSGINSPNPENIKTENIRKIFETNFFGTTNCIESVLEFFKSRKRGHISIVASTSGYRGLYSVSGYGASKAALINLTESLYLMLHSYGVNVTLINPGFVKTPLTDKNDFKMPFLVMPNEAAKKIYDGITKGKKFEITFPKFYITLLKLMRVLPYKIYLILMLKKVLYKLLYRSKKK
tara:strand:- start:2487 stop:3266 length:780 start_codon:yes stop_codon:yes gene_type:complete